MQECNRPARAESAMTPAVRPFWGCREGTVIAHAWTPSPVYTDRWGWGSVAVCGRTTHTHLREARTGGKRCPTCVARTRGQGEEDQAPS